MTLTKFVANTKAKATEVNTNTNATFTILGLNHIRQLFDRIGVYSAGQIEGWGEAYTSVGGRNSSVDTYNTDATFDTNKYKVDGTGEDLITHDIPSGTFSDTVSSVIGVPFLEDWETGADIQYKLQERDYNSSSSTATFYTDENTSNANDVLWNLTVNRKIKLKSITFSASSTITSITIDGQNATISGQVATFSSPIEFNNQTKSMSSVGNFHETITGSTTDSGWTIDCTSSPNEIGILSIDFYEYDNVKQDIGWLDSMNPSPEISSFTAFTSEPNTLIVKLIPKTTSPTAGYPSIKGFYVGAQ